MIAEKLGSNLFAALIWFRRPVNPWRLLFHVCRVQVVERDLLERPAERALEAMAD